MKMIFFSSSVLRVTLENYSTTRVIDRHRYPNYSQHVTRRLESRTWELFSLRSMRPSCLSIFAFTSLPSLSLPSVGKLGRTWTITVTSSPLCFCRIESPIFQGSRKIFFSFGHRRKSTSRATPRSLFPQTSDSLSFSIFVPSWCQSFVRLLRYYPSHNKFIARRVIIMPYNNPAIPNDIMTKNFVTVETEKKKRFKQMRSY